TPTTTQQAATEESWGGGVHCARSCANEPVADQHQRLFGAIQTFQLGPCLAVIGTQTGPGAAVAPTWVFTGVFYETEIIRLEAHSYDCRGSRVDNMTHSTTGANPAPNTDFDWSTPCLQLEVR